MALGSSLDPDDILALCVRMAIQVGMVLVAAWLPDTIKASGCGPNPGPLCDHWCQYRTWTSAQTSATQGPWTQHGRWQPLGLDVTTAPCSSMALRLQHGP